jgi:hypothetical protein
MLRKRAKDICQLLEGYEIRCLAQGTSYMPGHPLYLSYEVKPDAVWKQAGDNTYLWAE